MDFVKESMNLSYNNDENAYVFKIDSVCRKYIYYRTFSRWTYFSPDHGREQRESDPVIAENFKNAMNVLGLPWKWIKDDDALKSIATVDGWILFPVQFAKDKATSLLGNKTCVNSAIGLFWDVDLPRGRVCSRRIPSDIRRKVLHRDNFKCLECGKSRADGVELTMDHVIPFSHGGETSMGNLVTLCKQCNENKGNTYQPHLFSLAGLDHDWDPQLLDTKNISDPNAKYFAIMLSQNIMVSKCEIDKLPFINAKGIFHE